jgi:hypothetical protein
MNAMSTNPLTDLTASLLELGYTPGTPSAEVATIDAAVARGTRCPECGRRGRTLAPFVRPGGRSPYRAWAVCRACGAVEEI